jgi:hypothetical protein
LAPRLPRLGPLFRQASASAPMGCQQLIQGGLLPFNHTLSGAGEADAQVVSLSPILMMPSLRPSQASGGNPVHGAGASGRRHFRRGSLPLAQTAAQHRPLGLPRVALYNRARSGVLIVGENRRERAGRYPLTPSASGEYSPGFPWGLGRPALRPPGPSLFGWCFTRRDSRGIVSLCS